MFGRTRLFSVVGAAALLAVACAPAAPTSPTPAVAAKQAPAAAAAQPAVSPSKPAAASTEPAVVSPTTNGQPVADFYAGKTIRILVGFSPGGLFDLYSRLVAKYLPQYVPGSPTVIVENKPGAGSMLVANEVFNAAPKDGTVIGVFHESLVLLQAVEKEGVQFDARGFNWLGSSTQAPNACLVRKDSGIESLDQVMTGGKELILATIAPGTPAYDFPIVLKEVLGANFKMVPGYDSASKLQQAIERNEADGACWGWPGMRVQVGHWLEEGGLGRVIVITGDKTPDDPLLKGVPPANSFAKTPEARQVLNAVTAPLDMSVPFALPPAVPAERVAALREALAKVYATPGFLADAEKAELEVGPLAGQDVAAKVDQVLGTPPSLLGRLKELLK